MYSDVDIKMALKDGLLEVTPYDEERLQPASYDMLLSSTFSLPAYGSRVDPALQYSVNFNRVVTSRLELKPYGFALASTRETVRLSKYVAAHLDGKSSLARLGLQVHLTAGFIDPGFEGQITMELFNCNPVPFVLYAEMPIAQLTVFNMKSAVSKMYSGKYLKQQGPTESQYWKNFETN